MQSYQTVGKRRKVNIFQRVYSRQLVHVHGICNLCLLGILLLFHHIAYGASEIAVVSEYRLRNGRSQFRVHPAHQNGGTTESLGYPLAEFCFRIGEVVPDP